VSNGISNQTGAEEVLYICYISSLQLRGFRENCTTVLKDATDKQHTKIEQNIDIVTLNIEHYTIYTKFSLRNVLEISQYEYHREWPRFFL
jgi:hypothetical protein